MKKPRDFAGLFSGEKIMAVEKSLLKKPGWQYNPFITANPYFMKKAIFFSLFLGVFVFSCAAVLAQEQDSLSVEALEAVADSADLADETQSLDGVIIEKPNGIPTPFGLFWNNLKENVSLAFTFDPAKKAEKRIFYAERKIQWAEYMTENSDDPKIQERVQKVIEQAQKHIEKIEANKEKLLEKMDSRKQRALDNIARHEANKQIVLDKLEEKIAPEKLQQFEQMRQRLEERAQNFINNMTSNANIPQEVKEKIIENKNRIQERMENRLELMKQNQELIQEAKEGNAQAIQELKAVREQAKEKIQEAKDEYKQERTQIINKINSGDKNAINELHQLNQERKTELQQIRQTKPNIGTVKKSPLVSPRPSPSPAPTSSQ